MKLDRNLRNDGLGKYALIKLRDTPVSKDRIKEIVDSHLGRGVIDFGDTQESNFFVIRLKDKYAAAALSAYAMACMKEDSEYGEEIMDLAQMAARHASKRKPD